MKGLAVLDEEKLTEIMNQMKSERIERQTEAVKRRDAYLRVKKEKEASEEKARLKRQEAVNADMEDMLKQKAARMQKWFENLKDRDAERAREKRELLALLSKKEAERSKKEVVIPKARVVKSCPTVSTTSTLPSPSAGRVPEPRTPPMTSRSALSVYSKFSSPAKSTRVAKVPVSGLSQYARSTKIAASINSRKLTVRR